MDFLIRVFSFFEGGFLIFEILPISNFSQIRYKGGGRQISNFPQIQKVQNILEEGGGVKKIMAFFLLFVTFFNLEAPGFSLT